MSDLGTRFAVDVARSGDDETVVVALRAARGGRRARVVHCARGHDLMRTTGEVVRLLAAEPPAPGGEHVVVVDAIGLGAGVFDRLRELGVPVVAFNSAERALDPVRFHNRRAEAYWGLREVLIAGEVDLDPDDDDLAAQLGALRYSLTSAGRVLIESKAELRRRGLGSPDRADALAMAVDALAHGGAGSVAVPTLRPWQVEADRQARRDRAMVRLGSLCDEINGMAAAQLAGRLRPEDAVRRPGLLEQVATVRAEIAGLDERAAFEQDFGAGAGFDPWADATGAEGLTW